MGPSWPSAVVALGFLALVAVFFLKAVDSDDFEMIWAAVGTIVGVVTGAIPSFFFKAQADKASARAEAISAHAPETAVKAARESSPEAW